MKYVIDKGFIDRGAHISCENGYLDDKIYDSEEEAIKYAMEHRDMLLSDNEYFEVNKLDDDMEFVDVVETIYASDEAKEKYECIYY